MTDQELGDAITAQALINGEDWQCQLLWDGRWSREEILVRPAGSVLSVWRRVAISDFLAGK